MSTLMETLQAERSKLEKQLAQIDSFLATYYQADMVDAGPRISHMTPEGEARRKAGYIKYLERKRAANAPSNGHGRFANGFWEAETQKALVALGDKATSVGSIWQEIQASTRLPDDRYKAFTNSLDRLRKAKRVILRGDYYVWQ